MTLLEIAALARATKSRVPVSPRELFDVLRTNDAFAILPITIDIAEEDAALVWAIADPGDRAIVATARVHGLTLLTSDARIVDSKLVRVVD
jgi:PIN domain nuclease of toxin-antitoxin system